MTSRTLLAFALSGLAIASIGATQFPTTAPATPAGAGPVAVPVITTPRFEIAKVDGLPVYLDEFGEALHARITQPLLEDFARANLADIRATPAEIDAFLRGNPFGNMPAENRPDPAQLGEIARSVIERHKFQVALYRKFGGGRVLFQQAGMEAFDATKRMLEDAEKAGRFSIAEPHLRARFYGYWTMEHGPALSKNSPDDPMIQQFLSPPWNSAPAGPATLPVAAPSTMPATQP